MSYKVRERQRREQEILDTAQRLVAERGYAEVTMDDLADAVGISKPTLYQHFKSKEDLLAQAALCGLEQVERQLQEPSDRSPLQRLTEILRTLLHERYAQQGMLARLGPELAALHAHDKFRQHQMRVRTQLHALVDAGKAAGEINPAISTFTVVSALFSLLGSLHHRILWEAQADIDLDRMIEDVVQVFLYGVSLKS